jgi:hypothetical protein
MTDLEAQLARKRRNAKAGRARRKRGQYRRMVTIPGGQFRRLAELGYLERVDDPRSGQGAGGFSVRFAAMRGDMSYMALQTLFWGRLRLGDLPQRP